METRTIAKPIVALLQIKDVLYNSTTRQFNQGLLDCLKAHGIRHMYLVADFRDSFEGDVQAIRQNSGMATDQIVKRCQEEHFIVRGVLSAIDLHPDAAPGEGFSLHYLPILEEYRAKTTLTSIDDTARSGCLDLIYSGSQIDASNCCTTHMGLIYTKFLKELSQECGAVFYVDTSETNLLSAVSADVSFANKTAKSGLLSILQIKPFSSESEFEIVDVKMSLAKWVNPAQGNLVDLRLMQRDQFYFLVQHMARINPPIKYLTTQIYPLQALKTEIEAIAQNTVLSPHAQIIRFEKCVREHFFKIFENFAKPSYGSFFSHVKPALQVLNENLDHYHAERFLAVLLQQFYKRRHRLDEEFPWIRHLILPKGTNYSFLQQLPQDAPLLDAITTERMDPAAVKP